MCINKAYTGTGVLSWKITNLQMLWDAFSCIMICKLLSLKQFQEKGGKGAQNWFDVKTHFLFSKLRQGRYVYLESIVAFQIFYYWASVDKDHQ